MKRYEEYWWVTVAQSTGDGDSHAMGRLCEQWKDLVWDLAFKCGGTHSNGRLDDLTQEGFIAIIRAVQLFDLSKGLRLSTYAYPAIRHRMWRFKSDDTTVHSPQKSNVKNLKEETQKKAEAARHTVYLSSLKKDDGDSYSDYLVEGPGRSEDPTDEAIEGAVEYGCRDIIDERAKLIVCARVKMRTLESIGDEVGLTKERVRQILLKKWPNFKARVENYVESEGLCDRPQEPEKESGMKVACYECIHNDLCFLRKDIELSINKGIKMLNIDTDQRPKTFTDIYATVAESCLKYRPMTPEVADGS